MSGLPKIKLIDDGCRTGWERTYGLRKRHQEICRNLDKKTTAATTKDAKQSMNKQIDRVEA